MAVEGGRPSKSGGVSQSSGGMGYEEDQLTSSPLLLLPPPALPDGRGSETGCTSETGSLEG